MKLTNRAWPALGVLSVLQLAIAQAYAAPLALGNSPLFLGTATKANVLMLYGNSNSMDSDPTGKAVGSDAAASKSEVARKAIKSVVDGYTGYINMGLMAYQQNALVKNFLHDSQYDVSYDPANYDPAFTGARNSKTKKFRAPNPGAGSEYIYFNVNLPYYDGNSQGYRFCYAPTACTDPTHDFMGVAPACTTREIVGGSNQWDSYACFRSKTGTSDLAPPPDNGNGNGYRDYTRNSSFRPTDSDLGQGITDFGKAMAYQVVGLAWFNNGAPGMGYVHVPIGDLNAAQAGKINTKLGTSQFVDNMPTNPAYALQNGGLSPLEGAVLTANHYFNGTLSESAQGGALSAPPNSCNKNFLVTLTDGLPSVSRAGVPSANVVQNLSDLTFQVKALRDSAAKAETYVVGFALPYGVSITQLDTIAAAGGSNTAYNASDTATLNAAFASIFADIISKTSAASSVALNSQSVAVGAHVYQAKFSSGDWSGQLLDIAIQADGTLASTPAWDAGQVLNTIAPNARAILTNKSSANKGIAFRWPVDADAPTAAELDPAQVVLLDAGAAHTVGAQRLDYLRGAAANEGVNGFKWRSRPTSKLGDIVNSAPHYVGVPAFNYGEASYSTFRTANANRTKMIYVGANDGMLHGFDAGTGAEKIAYIPGPMHANLSKLTEVNFAHRYFVDGSPNTGDVYYGGAWHTVLVGGMGNGARGIFALDVTNPGAFSETNAATLVKFDFVDDEVGHVAGPVDIVKLNNGKWAALFGNGYNGGGDGTSTLYIVDIETGAVIRKLSTGAGAAATPNGLATPLAIDSDSDVTVDVVYAGDLLGNMWKFDLSASNPAQWKVDYKLFQASQPITSAPDAGEHPNGGYMVYFGTGKYLETSDISSTPGNTVYGIWDKGVGVSDSLVQQTFTALADINGVGYRTASSNPLNWTTHKGWFANFPSAGERMVSTPVLRGGRVIFTSIIPASGACSPGGTSWLNEVDWLTGGLLAVPPLDTNGDGRVDGGDTLVQGRRLDSVASAPAIQTSPVGPDLELNLLNQSDGTIARITGSARPKQAKRLSWRQIK